MHSADNLGVVSTHLLSSNLRKHMRQFTPQVRAAFMAELSRTGSSHEAARATGVRLNYLHLHMKHDTALAIEWSAALDRAFAPTNREQQP